LLTQAGEFRGNPASPVPSARPPGNEIARRFWILGFKENPVNNRTRYNNPEEERASVGQKVQIRRPVPNLSFPVQNLSLQSFKQIQKVNRILKKC